MAFRGTIETSYENWATDLKYSELSPYGSNSGVSIHGGFYNTYNTVDGQVLEQVAALYQQHPGAALWVSGHSLGAALATLSAMSLYDQGYQSNVVMYNFGSPRVGNTGFYTLFASRFGDAWRVTHWRDLVPHVPLKSMGFNHVSNEVWYNDEFTSYQVCDGSGEDPNCSDSLDVDTSIWDHTHYFNYPISNSC